MENQKSGFIPLYRSIRKKSWAKDVFLRTLWENLLMDAARKPYTANFKGHVWQLQPGQLVVTAADLGLQLCDRKGKPASRDAVERMLSVFVREGMISIDGEKQKGRVITILNYTEYAEKIDKSPAHDAAHSSAHDEARRGAALKGVPAHDAAHRTAQHEQEGNNNNINNKPPISPKGESTKFDPLSIPVPEWLNVQAWTDWVSNRAETKKPIKTERGVSAAFKLLKECFDEGHDPAEVINISIANGYQGLFKPKYPSKSQPRVTQTSKPMNHIPEGFTG